MSVSISDSASAANDTFDEENESHASFYANERGDRYSEDSSTYCASLQRMDPASKNKKNVIRMDPATNKPARVVFFPTSMVPNSHIKNAITGAFQGMDGQFFRVGSKDEDLFFSVILATGELGQAGPPTLFYDNPEQYERHFFTKLPKELKNTWEIKHNAAMFNLKLRQQRASERSRNGVILVK
jgi:hypothetical protein